jgi:hypothetical protein
MSISSYALAGPISYLVAKSLFLISAPNLLISLASSLINSLCSSVLVCIIGVISEFDSSQLLDVSSKTGQSKCKTQPVRTQNIKEVHRQ